MQAELARRTRNVTVVLDCGFSVQMSRDVAVRDANARALRPVHGVDAHLATLRTRYGMAFTDELVENVRVHEAGIAEQHEHRPRRDQDLSRRHERILR